MKRPALCQKCRREFMAEEEDIDNIYKLLVCPDCKADADIRLD